MLFLIAIDWVIRILGGKTAGITWNRFEKPEDLGIADDLCILTERILDIQMQIDKLIEIFKEVVLNINKAKTKILTKTRISNKSAKALSH